MRIYKALAQAFAAEGTDVSFTLMGDGNMHFATELSHSPGHRTFMVRHEHAAVAAASAWARMTGKVGVASTTCGPGMTQLSTALATAAQGRISLVVFAGESPIDKSWYGQRIDQGPIVTATGAAYIQAHSRPRMQEHVRDAFFAARTEKRPVVLGVPYDTQLEEFTGTAPYQPSTDYVPPAAPILPHPQSLAAVLEEIAAARRIVLVAGRGAIPAAALCGRLAERVDGMLATSLLARGLFDDDPYSLGICGGYASAAARDVLAEADLVIGVGASLNYHTQDGRKLFPDARVIQIDTDPVGLREGIRAADRYLRADARLALEAIVAAVEGVAPRPSSWRTPALAERLRTEPADPEPYQVAPGTMDPREVIAELDRHIPRDWMMVNATGHSAAFSAHMRGRHPDDFLTIREFGAVGNGLCYGLGAAAARPDQPIVVIDGDGSFLMHVQELETLRRHDLRVLVCILNDGAYGPEIHKLRRDGIDESGSVFGRGDMGAIGRAFGLGGRVITEATGIGRAIRDFRDGTGSAVLDLHVSDQVISPMMRRAIAARPRLMGQ